MPHGIKNYYTKQMIKPVKLSGIYDETEQLIATVAKGIRRLAG